MFARFFIKSSKAFFFSRRFIENTSIGETLEKPNTMIFKDTKNNLDIVDYIAEKDPSPFYCSLALRYISLNVLNKHDRFNFLKSPKFDNIKTYIEASVEEFSFNELSSVLFFMRILRNYRIPRVFAKTTEEKVIKNITEDISNCKEIDKVIEVFINLSLIKNLNAEVSNKLRNMIKVNGPELNISDLCKIINGCYHSNIYETRYLALDVIRLIEDRNIDFFTNEQIINIIMTLRNIDERFNIGHFFIETAIEVLLDRLRSMSIPELLTIIDFYAKTNDYSRELLSSTLNMITQIMSQEQIKPYNLQILAIRLSEILKIHKNIKIDQELIDKMHDRILINIKRGESGHYGTANIIAHMSDYSNNIPKKIVSEIFDKFYREGLSGMWQILLMRGFSHLTSLNEDEVISDFNYLEKNILKSSVNVHVDAIINICKTNSYKNSPKLHAFLGKVVNNLKRIVKNPQGFTSFYDCFESQYDTIHSIEEFQEVLVNCIDFIYYNWDQHKKWLLLRHISYYYNESPRVKKKWFDVVGKIKNLFDINDISSAILNDFNIKIIPAAIKLVKLTGVQNDEMISHFFSFRFKEANDDLIEDAISLVNSASPAILNNKRLNISKRTLFYYIFSSGKGNSLKNFIEKVSKSHLGENFYNYINFSMIVAEYGLLPQELAARILKTFNEFKNEREFLSFLSFGLISNSFSKEKLDQYIERLFSKTDNMGYGLLHESVNIYLMYPWTHSNENEFLQKIEIKMASTENKNILSAINFLEGINTTGHMHKDFISSLFNTAAEVFKDKVRILYPSICIKILILFAKKGYINDDFYEAIEKKAIINIKTVPLENLIKLMKCYKEINRFNNFFRILYGYAIKDKNCDFYSDDINEFKKIIHP